MDKSINNKLILEAVTILDKELVFFKQKYNLGLFMSKEDIEDMRGDCILNLIETVKRFDTEKNCKLITFILPRIRGFFKDYMIKENKIKKLERQHFVDIVNNKIDHLVQLSPGTVKGMMDTINLDSESIREIYHSLSELDNDLAEEIIESISTLSDKKLYIIVGFYFLDKDIKEIASDLGFSNNSGWVYKMKKKSIKHLKGLLVNKNEPSS